MLGNLSITSPLIPGLLCLYAIFAASDAKFTASQPRHRLLRNGKGDLLYISEKLTEGYFPSCSHLVLRAGQRPTISATSIMVSVRTSLLTTLREVISDQNTRQGLRKTYAIHGNSALSE